jgi:uncharacterized RmlC-like cupin family protein
MSRNIELMMNIVYHGVLQSWSCMYTETSDSVPQTGIHHHNNYNSYIYNIAYLHKWYIIILLSSSYISDWS